MRFSTIITYLTLAAVSAVFALPVHPTQHETASGTTTSSAVTPREGHSDSAPPPSVVLPSLSEDVEAKSSPELAKRTLNLGPLTKQGHAAEKEYHLQEKETQEELDRHHTRKAARARGRLDAEREKANPNEELIKMHKNDVKYHVAKSMEASERAMAHGAGAEYHGAMRTVAQVMSHSHPNQHDMEAVGRLQQKAGTAIRSHDAHNANADEYRGKAA
ncbi:hypothetical protein FRC17_000612, partial [Serendipita sp. 399]